MKLSDWLVRTFRPSQRRSEMRNDPVEAISRELAKPPEMIDLGNVVPMLVPSAFSAAGNWPGPIHRLGAPGFDQTWAVICRDNVLLYVSRPMQSFWEQADIDWRERAASNLRAFAEAEPWSHTFVRADGSPFMVAMLFGRGLGPSRLLVPGLLTAAFPEGYEVAVPEMTCAVAFTATPTNAEKEKIIEFVSHCFEHGSEPVSAACFSPTPFGQLASDDLGLPA